MYYIMYDTRIYEYEYFKKGKPVLPTLWTCGEQANTESLRE